MRVRPAVSAAAAARAPLTGPSAVARALAHLAPAIDAETCRQFVRLLAHSIAAPTPQIIRRARLGLLMQMLRANAAELVLAEDYERECRRRRRHGERWPSYSLLSRAFGDWRTAQIAALHLAYRGLRSRQAASRHHTGWREPYTEQEVVDGLIATRNALGVWPLGTEYFELRALQVLLARAAGLVEPRLPSRGPMERLFGSVGAAISEARTVFGEPDDAYQRILIDLSELGTAGISPADTAGMAPLTARLWDVARDLPEADRRVLYMAFARGMRRKRSLAADLCMRALIACQTDMPGDHVSRRAYTAWRAAQDAPNEWPTPSFIRSTYGDSWTAALDDAALDPICDVLVRRMIAPAGRGFAEAELIAFLSWADQELPPGRMRFQDYRRLALTAIEREHRPFPRMAIHPGTFNARFGTWARALLAAGLPHRAALDDPSAHTSGSSEEFADRVLIAYLQAAAAPLDGARLLTPRCYDRWATKIRGDRRANGDVSPVPSYRTIRGRFGGWAEALLAAQLVTDRAYLRRVHTRGFRLGRTRGLQLLKEAVRKFGSGLTRREYTDWREERLNSADPPVGGIPSPAWIQQELGNGAWRPAVARALAPD